MNAARVTPICTTHRQIGATPNPEEAPVYADSIVIGGGFLVVIAVIILLVLILRR